MIDATWAIISEHGVVHRTEAQCLAITNAVRGKQRIKEVSVKQVVVYHLPPCNACWPTVGSFKDSLRKAMASEQA